MLQSNTWTKIPGTFEVDIYPIIRKPCVICSSTFILRSPENIVIIDPGGDRTQLVEAKNAIIPLISKKGLPVTVFLTHCHVDHYVEVSHLFDSRIKGILVCHPYAARAIEERDTHITGADMVDVDPPEVKVHKLLPLVSAEESIEIPGGCRLIRQTFDLNAQDTMEIYHTPGHSPDGLSYRVGNYLFSGDLHLATTPGIVGLVGWDGKTLVDTLDALMYIGRSRGVELLLPGHGVPFPFEKAGKVFEPVKKEAVRLSGIVRMNRTRADYISEYAIILLEEAGNLFSIISGRLLKVSYYLEMLEETENARSIMGSIDTEAIDKAVDEFYYFTKEIEGGGIPLIARAVNFAKSIEKIFEPEKVGYLFEIYLLRRLKNLLSDFVNVAYGVHFDNQEAGFDVNNSIRKLLTAFEQNPHQSESILESLENDETYMKELTMRIAFEPLFSNVRFNFMPGDDPIIATADEYTFHDTVSALLEQFAISGIKNVDLVCVTEEDKVVLQITDSVKDSSLELRSSKLSYLDHSMRLAGGHFNQTVKDEVTYYRFELPLTTAKGKS